MNLNRFQSEREASWSELTGLIGSARGKPERLGPAGVRRLGTLYREAAADLALARRAFPGDPIVRRLENLVVPARQLVYDAPSRRISFVRFFTRDYWRLIASRPVPLLLAAVLLFGPALLAGSWALRDPGAAAGLVPGEYQSVTEERPEGSDLGLSAQEESVFASSIFTNNIKVTFLAFATGILLGLGTAFLLVYNGVLLGVVAGLATGAGNGRTLAELVLAHGVLELSCIVVCGAAGLRLGWAIVEPGRGTRRHSVMREARRGIGIVLGTVPWLVLAGLVEGFLTPAGTGLVTVAVVGVGLGAVYWLLVLWRGVPAARAARAPSPSNTPRRMRLQADPAAPR